MLGRLTWTDFGLVLLLAIPASAMPETAPRSIPQIESPAIPSEVGESIAASIR